MQYVSQSMVKNFQEYKQEVLCGDIFLNRYQKKKFDDAESKAMQLGIYFEFVLTGNLPKSGNVPNPEFTLDGKKLPPKVRTVQHMKSEYKLCHENAGRVKFYLKEMGWDIIGVGRVFKNRKLGMVSDTDLVLKDVNGHYFPKGTEFIGDVKYTGLLNDKWKHFGWSLETEVQRDYHNIQPMHYHLTTKLPFVYIVVSNDGDGEIKLMHVDFSEQDLLDYQMKVEETREAITMLNEIGWNNYPKFNKCQKCKLANRCKTKALFPPVEKIRL